MKVVLALAVSMCFLIQAHADTVTVNVGDNAIYWLDYGSGTANSTRWQEDADRNGTYQPTSGIYSAAWKNTNDVIGGPDFAPSAILLNQVVYDSRYESRGTLLSVAFHHSSDNRLTLPGDLFIDIGDDGNWDYVIQSPHGNNAGVDITAAAAAADQSWRAFSGQWDYTATTAAGLYQLAHESRKSDGTAWGSNYVIRTDHPWRVADANLNDDILKDSSTDGFAEYLGDNKLVGFSGWITGQNVTNQAKFDLSSLGINLFDANGEQIDIRFGFTVNCANDVVFQSLPSNLNLEVPEPASLAIWSLLALGTASGLGIRRKKGGRRRWSDDNRKAIREIVQGDR